MYYTLFHIALVLIEAMVLQGLCLFIVTHGGCYIHTVQYCPVSRIVYCTKEEIVSILL